MPRIRPDIASIKPYVPGKPVSQVARDVGLAAGDMIKLASNESPWGPFPGVVESLHEELGRSNRYPDNDLNELRADLAEWLEVPGEYLWFGSGSVSLLGHIALACGGPGTSAVYSWPSFVMYRTVSRWAMTDPIEVDLTTDHTLDLGAMEAAVRADTSIVYICNPNNPTGTVVSSTAMMEFIDSVSEDVLIVVDEAYHDFVGDETYSTAIARALTRPNVLVLRTFSKVFALAAHRIGYAIGRPETISELRKAQAPFSVSQIAQVAARSSLGQRDEWARRVEANAAGRALVLEALADLGVPHAKTEANFAYLRLGDDSQSIFQDFVRLGIIVRPLSGGWIRATIGTMDQNRRLVDAIYSIRRSTTPTTDLPTG